MSGLLLEWKVTYLVEEEMGGDQSSHNSVVGLKILAA